MSLYFSFLVRDLRSEVSYRLSFILQIVGIFPIILMFFYLSKLFEEVVSAPLDPYGGDYFPFVIIGIAFQNYLTQALSSFSRSIRVSQMSGTLEAVLAAPVRLHEFLLGSTAYSFVFNSFRIFLYLGVCIFVFKAPFVGGQILLFFLVLGLTLMAFSSLGIFSASFILLFKKGDPINWGIGIASWLLGGVYYPVSILPVWMQKMALFIPMRHSLESFRVILLQGGGLGHLKLELLSLGLWVVVGLPLSVLCFKLALKRAKQKGTLGFY